jgi:tripartite-type tricarboxylate transporter receptor subunit TctC
MAGNWSRRSFLAFACGLSAVASATAASYPTQPIKIVVPLAAGGPADHAARIFAPHLSKVLGQPVIVENRSGGSSVVGTQAVVSAPADGYTLLFGSSSAFAVNPAVMQKLPFDVEKDLTLISLISQTPHVLVVRSEIPVASIAELVKLAKDRPGKLTYASSGQGGAIHLASELFKRETGTDLLHIPYRGGGPAVIAMLSGEVDMFINDFGTTLEHVKSGKLRALAIANEKRSSLMPDLPTFAEVGYPVVISSSWFGLAAPVKTPPEIIASLRQAVQAVSNSDEYKAGLARIGLEQIVRPAAEADAFIARERAKWKSVAQTANVQVD